MATVSIERSKPRVLVMSFGFSMAIVIALVVVLLASGGTAEATSYAITSSGGPIKDWNTPATWTPAGVPGSAPGDTVNIGTANAQVQLTTGLANPLAGMSLSGTNVVVEVSGGNLSLAGPSTVGSFSTLRTISGGTVLISGTSLTIGANGLLQSLGGTLDGGGTGTLTIQTSGQVTVGTAQTTATNGLNIINTGGSIVINGATLAINNNAFITNTSGTIDLQSTSGITSDNVGTKINVDGGTLTKSTVAGAVVVALPVNTLAAGTIASSNGTLSLSQGGTHSGTFSASPGTIEFSGGTHQFSGTPTFSGNGAFVVSGGTFDLDATSIIPATAGFTQSGGLLTGAGDLTVNGPFIWSGGLIDGSSGSGATNIMATLDIAGAAQKDYSTRTINNFGTTTWTGGNIRTDFGGVFNNTGTFDIQCDKFLFWGFAGLPLAFNNSGTVTKSTTFGTSTIAMEYSQTAGSTTINTGTFTFNNRGGTYTGGTVSASAGARLNFASGDAHTFMAGSTISGAGTIGLIAGATFFYGTYNVTGTTDMPGGTGRFEATATTNQLTLSGGNIAGAGTLTVTGAATWSGFGTMSGAGGTTTFQPGSTLAITGVQDKFHTFRTINNAGTVTWSGGNLNAGGGATFNNTGTFDIQSDNSYLQNQSGALSVFNNSGTITKSVTAGTSTFNVAFNQLAGSTTISSGQLTLSNGGSSTGVIAVTNTANQVNITSGTYTMNAGTSVTGNGFITVSGSSTQLTAGAPLTIPRITLLDGTIGGANLTIANALLWRGGRFLGPGTTTMSGGSTVDHTTSTLPTSLDARTFSNSGTFNYTPNVNFLTLTNGAAFNNNLGGSFNILGNGQIGNGAGSNSFTNASTVVKSGGAGGTTFNVPVTNTNAIGVTAANGTLIFGNGGSMSAGGITAGVAGSSVHFFGGVFTVTGGGFSGSSGTVAVLGSGQLNIAASVFSTTNFAVQSGGTLDVASGRVFALDQLSWTGGTIQGPGQTRVTISGVIGNTSPTTLAGGNSLTIDGTLNYDADSTNFLTLTGSSQLVLFGTGTMKLRADGILAGVTPASVTNAGTLLKTLGSGASRIDPQFISTGGTVGATIGTLHLKTGGGGLTSTTIDTGANAKVEFEGIYGINAGSSVTGTGTIQVTSGALTITPNVTIPTLVMSGGTLAGPGAVTLTSTASPSQWLGGTITGSGALTAGAGTTFQINGTNATMLLDGRTLTSNGTLTYSSPLNALSFANGASIINAGSFNVSTAIPINVSVGGGTIQNNGTFTRITDPGSGTIAPAFTNANSVSLQAGTTTFSSFTQSSGTLALAGGNMASPVPVTITSGNVTGAGTIGASLSNGGTILPGAGLVTGIISLGGTYAQTSTGKLELDLGGSTPGTYDALSSTGQPTLAGELKVNLISGFVPANGDTFNILGYNTTPATDFTTNTFPPFGTGGVFNKSYLPAMLQLAAAVPTADVAISQTTSGPAHTNDTVTFTVTVTNTDTAFTASGVSLTNTFSGPFTFLTSSTTLGSCTGTNCNLGNLAPGASAVITLTGTATGPGTISNSASSSSSTPDPNTANNLGVVASIAVTPRADVTVTITDAPDPVIATGNITYTVSVNNAGPNSATSAAVALTVTNGSISASTSSAFTCSGTGASASCTAATLATGVSTITVTVQAGTQGTTVLGASYTSSTFDNNVADNTASQSTTITPQADLGIVKSGPASATPGTIVYSVTVTNGGPSDAASVTVADATPAGLSFVSNSGACTTSYPCSLGTVLAGATATITSTYTIASSATIPITNTATVTTTTADPNTANNSSTVTTTITPLADVQIVKSGPASAAPASIIPYTITVTNVGPSNAANVTVNDPTPSQTTLVSVGGACSAFPCSLGNLTNGQTVSINASYQLLPGATGPSVTNTASVTTSTTESNVGNNSSSVTTAFACISNAPSVFIPDNAATGVPTSGLLLWDDSTAESYIVYLGPASSNGCSTPFASSNVPSAPYSGLLPNTKYAWRVEASAANCPTLISACVTFTTGANCNVTIPLVRPLGGTTSSPMEFEWQPASGASEYTVFARTGGGAFDEIGKTSSTKLTASLITDGTVQWYVAANVAGCGIVQSATATFSVCNRPDPPLARLVGEVTSSRNYRVEWDSVPNAIRYEVDESNNPSFTGATTQSTTANFVQFKHDAATTPLAFYYRVRAFSACSPSSGDNSPTTRIVIVPLPSGREPSTSASIPAGSQEIVLQRVFIPGEPGQQAFFTATTDRPWMTVRPASGTLPPEGITLEAIADPTTLPNGTFTATIIVTITTPTFKGIAANGTTVVSKPVSVNLVTPVTPVQNKTTPSADALVIPSVGHLDGANSQWQSDIRVTNTGTQNAKYALTFTPSTGTASGIRQTTIAVDAGATTALDDIIKNWFGLGSLSDGTNGTLEIRTTDNSPLTAVASSRTYSATANGTLGQYIPALPFSGFVGKAVGTATPTSLSMQQIAQSSLFRTNVGFVEASGKSASVLMSVFTSAGSKLLEIPLSLNGGEARQVNSILASNNIVLSDGRIEMKVTGGEGKVTAYASVVDNATNDPLLVSGVATNQAGAPKYVLAGVADLTTSVANWRTDVRIFNTTPASHSTSLTLYPLGGGTPLTANLTLQAGEVRVLNDIVKALFGASNIGGAIHVSTTSQANLIVTGRTYNQTSNGTIGQFIEAVTPDRAASVGGKTLNILQVEDSPRYRTNLGIAEVTGQPVTVEVQVVIPDSKVTPKITFPMAANEFRQFGVIRELNLGNIYNARITVRVVEGQGRVTAYGSVIDMITQDPTYVPAQ